MNSSGFSIIRWQSSGKSVTLRSDFTTGGPMVRFGTKCPSMISTWMTLPPPSAAACTCSPSRAKSAERIDGASSIKPELSEHDVSETQGNGVDKILSCCRVWRGHSLRQAQGRLCPREAGQRLVHGANEAA